MLRKYLCRQDGMVAVLAIIAMVVLAICLAGLLPYVSTLTRASANNIDVLQAQYAAEAGAKRALVSLDRNAVDNTVNYWTWLNEDCNLTTVNNTDFYNVTIMILKNGAYSAYTPPANTVVPTGTYNIKSVGTVQNNGKTTSATVYLRAVVMVNNRVDFKSLGWSN